MKTILVVDDEPKITQLVRDYLERAGYSVLVAYDGKKALSLAKTEKPDMVVLDLGLPQLDGLDFTREFRKTSNAPIIMLTARSDESDKLIGLELGADDYMTKPFSPKELVARVRVVFRRIENALSANAEMSRVADLTLDDYMTKPFSPKELVARVRVVFRRIENALSANVEMIRVADLTLDVPRMRTTAENREIEERTPTEFELLATLARQPGRVFTRAQLLDAIHCVANAEIIRVADLTLDVPRMRTTAENREIEELTPTEFELLATLARQPGRVFPRAHLLD